jgi:hypothetical protein
MMKEASNFIGLLEYPEVIRATARLFKTSIMSRHSLQFEEPRNRAEPSGKG